MNVQTAPTATPYAACSSPGGDTPARNSSLTFGARGHALPAAIPAGAPGAGSPPVATVATGLNAPGASSPAPKVQGRTMAEWIAQARKDLVSGSPRDQVVAVVYAAAAAQRGGVDADGNPFCAVDEAGLHTEWQRYFQVAASATHREKPGTGARAEFAVKRRTSSRRVTTTSVAYAEQCGGAVVAEDGV